MNYFEHHIGDYAAATGHLSLIEDAVYTRMLRRYYLQEGPLPSDWRQVARLVGARSQEELDAVEAVLVEFFELKETGWHQKRADADIAKFQAKQDDKSEEKAHEAERKRRYRERRAELFELLRAKGIVPAFDTPMEELVRMLSYGTVAGQDGDGTATQSPVTKHQTPEDQKQKGGKPPALTLPDWLPANAWADWHAFRNQRKGWTHKARELSLATLGKLRTQGHDPTAVIEQSIERGWTGLFEIKNTGNSHANSTSGRKLSAVDQVAAAIRERREHDPFDDEDAALVQIGYG